MNKSLAGIVLAVLFILFAAPANSASPVKASQKTCQKDTDCAVVVYSCEKCCPDLDTTDGVNKKYEKVYERYGQCTSEHLKSCGVPECGLESPEPAAVCNAGICGVTMRWANEKPG